MLLKLLPATSVPISSGCGVLTASSGKSAAATCRGCLVPCGAPAPKASKHPCRLLQPPRRWLTTPLHWRPCRRRGPLSLLTASRRAAASPSAMILNVGALQTESDAGRLTVVCKSCWLRCGAPAPKLPLRWLTTAMHRPRHRRRGPLRASRRVAANPIAPSLNVGALQTVSRAGRETDVCKMCWMGCGNLEQKLP